MKVFKPISFLCVGVLIFSLASCQLLPVILRPTREPETTAPALEYDGVHRLTYDEFFYERPVWSPDGKTIAVGRNTLNLTAIGPDLNQWEIVLFDVKNGESRVLSIDEDFSFTYPAWSPDGEHLAFTAYDKVLNRQIIYSFDDGSWRQLECLTCDSAVWSQDGSEIFMLYLVGATPGNLGEPGVVRMDVETGETIKEYVLGDDFLSPFALAPDEKSVLIPDFRCTGIWKFEFESQILSTFIDAPEMGECDPAWSWDGSKLAYTVKDLPTVAPTYLMISNADGSDATALLKPELGIYQIHDLAWSPDGTQIAFVYGLVNITMPAYTTLYIVDVPEDLQPGHSQ